MRKLLSIGTILAVGVGICMGVVYFVNHHKDNGYSKRLEQDMMHIAKTDSLIASAELFLTVYDEAGNIKNIIEEIDKDEVEKINDLKNKIKEIKTQLNKVRSESVERTVIEVVDEYQVDSLSNKINSYESDIVNYVNEISELKSVTADSIMAMEKTIQLLKHKIYELEQPHVQTDTITKVVLILDTIVVKDEKVISKIKKRYL